MKKKLTLIIIAAVALVVLWLVEREFNLSTWQLLLLYLVPYLLVGHEVLAEAAEGIMDGDAFDENLLMSVATLGAMFIGFLPGAEPQFAEAVFVMMFFQVGELIEHYAEHRSRDAVGALLKLRPDESLVVRDGDEVRVASESVGVGETVVVRPGDRVPLDGVVCRGVSSVNAMAITGESVPVDVCEGDFVAAGSVNLSGVLHLEVTKPFGESTMARIISLVEEAGEKKSQKERFITRFARVYTPIVVFAALALAFVPPLFAAGGYAAAFPVWLYRALIFLVVSCPCALVISVPLTFFSGIGGASRKGILIKGATNIDSLAKLANVVLDKTGTLTHGEFEVAVVHPEQLDEEQLLHLAAHVERHSTHPIAMALRNAFPNEGEDGCVITDVVEIAGQGVRAEVNGKQVCVGNERMMKALGISIEHTCHHSEGATVHVAVDGGYAGHIVVADKVKTISREALERLKSAGVRHTVMLTGDSNGVAKNVAQAVGVDEWHAELTPEGKVEQLERVMATNDGSNATTAFVGDGINDAPVLARADVGIAMGALGSEAAIEAADVVIMDDNPGKIALAKMIARRTTAIATQNICFAIAVKIAVLVLSALGYAPMWLAVFADVGVTVIAIVNAMRALFIKE